MRSGEIHSSREIQRSSNLARCEKFHLHSYFSPKLEATRYSVRFLTLGIVKKRESTKTNNKKTELRVRVREWAPLKGL